MSKNEPRRRRLLVVLVVIGALLLLLHGCGSLSKLKPYKPYRELCGTPSEDQVLVTYLGCGGFLIRRGERALLIEPFFSNPGLMRVLFGRISSDETLIDDLIKEKILPDVSDVSAILVGHAHHDHLMDVPYLAKKAPDAAVYLSLTGKCILAPSFREEGQASRLKPILEEGPIRAGVWIPIGEKIRFMALVSEHAPHLAGLSAFDGSYSQDLEQPPKTAAEYRKGQVFSFVVEFLGEGRGEPRVDFRIYLQSAASSKYKGFPPISMGDFDLAILCAASFQGVDEYPEGILERTRPKNVIIAHWENFFRGYRRSLKTVPATDVRAFIERVKSLRRQNAKIGPWLLPAPGACMAYPIGNH